MDTGDTFSDVQQLLGDRVANAMATAELLVDRYNLEGVRAQNIGERDLALGRAALESLKARAKYPFVTTNLVDKLTGEPLFSRFVLIDATHGGKHVKLAIFGLMSLRPQPSLETDKLTILPPVDALRSAMVDAKAQGAEVMIVLSQLLARDESEIGEAIPEVQLFLGGDFMGMSPEPQLAGSALSFAGSQKGKHVGFLKLAFGAPSGPGAAFTDPKRKAAVERRRSDAQRRIETYERLIEEAKKAETAPPDPKRPKVPVETYERQVASAKAELQLANDELTSMGESDKQRAAGFNMATLELIPLSRDVVDDPAVKAVVDEFRKKWPDLTP